MPCRRRITWHGKARARSLIACKERLTSSDRGVVLLREVMLREMRRVQEGHDPLGVVRDPNQNTTMIDTHLSQTIQQFGLVGADQAVNG